MDIIKKEKRNFSFLYGALLPVIGFLIAHFFSNVGIFNNLKSFSLIFILSCASFYFGFKKDTWQMFSFIFGAYISINIMSYIFGTTDARSYFLLGLFATWLFLVFPIIFGFLGRLIAYLHAKYLKNK